MILSYSLGNNIVCEKLCKDLAKAIAKISQSGQDMSRLQLVIDIKHIVDSQESLLPKLEHKNL